MQKHTRTLTYISDGPSAILPIPVTPGDASTCGTSGTLPCTAPGWVFCTNAVCDNSPTVDAKKHGGKPFAKCQCWQPSNTNQSFVPRFNTAAANCVLGTG